MQDSVARLRTVVERSTPALLALPDSRSVQPPAPGKWSPREVLGHLIDSASHNHRRFVLAQLQDDLIFPGYDQEAWVGLQQYREASWTELVTLWRAFNLHLAHVMDATPEAVRLRPRHRHNLDEIAWRPVPADEPATLAYFMSDYVSHLEHHLSQILDVKDDQVPLRIREYRPDDTQALRRCIVDLQEFERGLDPTLRPGESMADSYWARVQAQCAESHGKIFVADLDGHVVGFVAALAAHAFTEPDDPPGTCALITDLVVLSSHRHQGIGRRLLHRAETFIRTAGARECRVEALAGNASARRLYLDSGFVPHLEVFTKRW